MKRYGDERKKQVYVNITIDTWLSGKTMADEKGMSFSSFVEELIKEAFEKFKAGWTEVKDECSKE